MQRTDFHFELPDGAHCATPRDAALREPVARARRRECGARAIAPSGSCLLLLRAGDLLVFNDTRVVPARVHGTKDTGGKVELLLERAESAHVALVQARASKGLKTGAT